MLPRGKYADAWLRHLQVEQINEAHRLWVLEELFATCNICGQQLNDGRQLHGGERRIHSECYEARRWERAKNSRPGSRSLADALAEMDARRPPTLSTDFPDRETPEPTLSERLAASENLKQGEVI